MIVVGNNLKELIKQFGICPNNLFDETGIEVQLSNKIRIPNNEQKENIKYNVTDLDSYYIEKKIENGILILKPNQICLGCSKDEYYLPLNYFGMLQTKGTLARLFITTNVTDCQIDPGYKGKITLELINLSPFTVEIPIDSKVAKIYIYKCSTNALPYNGRYQNAIGPTISISDHR